jgi:hypothetical protein
MRMVYRARDDLELAVDRPVALAQFIDIRQPHVEPLEFRVLP